MKNAGADVRRRTLAYVSPDATLPDRTLPMDRGSLQATIPVTSPAGASKRALAALLGETELAPSTVPSGSPTSLAPASTGPRVTVLPRVEMVGAEPRVVSEARVRYLSENKLGEGGLGEVLGARDQDIGRRVAVKRLRPEVKSDAALLRFAEEVRTIGRLEHPNIVPVHDVGIDEQGDHYFVMKYVDGETLEQVIERLAARDPAYTAKYTIERRVEIFMALCEAVSFAHAQGIIHRDIKPANVMVGAYGEVVLMDWGVAKLRGVEPAGPAGQVAPTAVPGSAVSTQAGAIVGTPFYMSPEQAKGLPADERSDIYSLCLLFYELLTLQHPLEKKESLEDVLHCVVHECVPSVLEIGHTLVAPVPAELHHFLRHGLEKDPDARYPDVTAMLDRLRARAMGDIPIECPVTFIKSTTGRWTRFVDAHPFAAIGAASSLVLGAVASIVLGVVLVIG